jgi:hypothetical protein
MPGILPQAPAFPRISVHGHAAQAVGFCVREACNGALHDASDFRFSTSSSSPARLDEVNAA